MLIVQSEERRDTDMNMTLGIDVGGSTTKIVGLRGGELSGTLQVRAADQITSLYGAVGNFLNKYGAGLSDVESIALTGVGASFFDEPIYGIETRKVGEFEAIGRGALLLTGLREALVVSLGTGTAYVMADGDGFTHIGGSGVGGGTIVGLSSLLLRRGDIDAILAIAEGGKPDNVDLPVREIVAQEIPSLPPNLTAANFGRIVASASESDIAAGIINMVFQTAGMLAVFAAKGKGIKDIVLTGTLTTFPQINAVFTEFREITGLNFIIPSNAVYATALGAAAE
jgi:type II pantothenate kinase